IQSQMLRMAPGAALEPTDVNRIVGVSQAVDIFGGDPQVDDERLWQIPAHDLCSRLAARSRASLASWVIWSQARARIRLSGAIQVPPTQATLGRLRKRRRLSAVIPPVGQNRMPVNGRLKLLSISTLAAPLAGNSVN